jgi:hypothetical protein
VERHGRSIVGLGVESISLTFHRRLPRDTVNGRGTLRGTSSSVLRSATEPFSIQKPQSGCHSVTLKLIGRGPLWMCCAEFGHV